MAKKKAPPFGPRLKELREAAGLTQHDLAEKAGMHRQGIVKLERGEREPAWSTLFALAEALDVEVQEFATGSAVPTDTAEPAPSSPAAGPSKAEAGQGDARKRKRDQGEAEGRKTKSREPRKEK